MSAQRPKGKLLIIGGAENKGERPGIDENAGVPANFHQLAILKTLLNVKKKRTSIEVILTATEEPAIAQSKYTSAFKKIGFAKIGFIDINNREEARDPEFVVRVSKAHVVFFSGGDQFRLTTIFGSSPVIDEIQQRYYSDSDFIVAGTSAGAMAVARVMIDSGPENEAVLKGAVKISAGFGFIDNCIIDTHFVNRGRFGRLTEAVIINPDCIGIGLGEDTALLINKGNEAKCIGSGMVVIIDGSNVNHSNIAYIGEGEAVCVENMIVHILVADNGYLIREKKFQPSKQYLRIEKHLVNY